MPGLGEPLHNRLSDDRAHALGGRQLVHRRRPDRVHRAEVIGQRPCRGRPDVADRQAHQHSPQRLLLGGLQIRQQLVAGRRQHASIDDLIGRVRLLGRPGVQGHPHQLCGGQVEKARLVRQHPAGQQPAGPLPAQGLDVEAVPRCQREQPFGQLSGAGLRVRAADVLVGFLFRTKLRPADRAVGGHHEGSLGAIAQFHDRPEDLRDHVTGLAQHDGVTDQHALAGHFPGIVQGGPRDRGTGDLDRLHHRKGGHAAGASDIDLDIEQLGVHLFGRVLVGDRPARRP